MDERQALLARQGVFAGLEPAQLEHLRVPMLSALRIAFPGADAGVSGDQRRALARLAQRLQRAALLGDVHRDAEDAAPVDMDAIDIGAHHDPARAAVAAQSPELELEGALAGEEIGACLMLDAGAIVGMHRARDPFPEGRRLRRRAALEELEHLRVPVGASRSDGGRPDADAGRTRGGFEAARKLLGMAQVLDALGHVEGHADEGERLACVVALDDPARQHVAPGAVDAAIARLEVGRLGRPERVLPRSDHGLDVVRVDERADLVDRDPFGPRRQAEKIEGPVAVVHAAGAQVVAPDRDLAELDGHLELGIDVAQRPRRVVGLGVVEHDAEGAFRHAARTIANFPLRMDPARRAIALHDPEALRVAARAPGRLRVDRAHAVFRMHLLDRAREARRAGRRIEVPEPEHVLVPTTFAGGDLPLPDAEATELLGRIEQFVLPGRALFERLDVRDVDERPENAARKPRRVRVDPDGLAACAAQLDPPGVRPLRAQQARDAEAAGRTGSARRREVQERRLGSADRAGRVGEALVAPEDRAGRVGDGEQVTALRDQRLEEIGRQLSHDAIVRAPAPGANAREGRPRAGFQSFATCSTSLPKFSPRKSLSKVSGKVSRPTTTSSRLFMRPSFR